ncbi:hypothetical protein [Pusillimonas noertemannii]|uniref:Uncharacterized protein n=1 Tax=Pusillimonas noertemannii TaxID=305977 RepID=A0A2U1CRF7_9BURK|nr:hypothetical protein [Pusillimonas noertemannii]NYT67710.1 hypothetical protein [Pusillimonas noertemannii]PVY68381.1 hypothetical protein C7440_0778 [Pusillimonas noertemannii]TFL12134.1 hypothetical protein CSC72_03160 [Pusillimonas noertemannii]
MILLKQIETPPAAYKAVTGLSTAAAALDAGVVWQRIENWIAYRWPMRTVVWMVEGSGLFVPPLADWSIDTIEKAGKTWEEADLGYSVTGIWLEGATYRVRAQVGSDDDLPAAVAEAYRRLAEYMAEVDCMPAGVTRVTETVGQLSSSMSRAATSKAQALQMSGAADLLRPWRTAP